MILGMSPYAFTLLHVIISLIAIASGLVVLAGLLASQLYRRCNSLFVVTASLTSVTGFAFPNAHITPGIIVGILSLIVLALAVTTLHIFRLDGAFRATFVVSTVVAIYLNVFVLIAQLFRHVPFLTALDPTGSGPLFGAIQVVVFALFGWLGFTAVRRFKNKSGISPAQTARRFDVAERMDESVR